MTTEQLKVMEGHTSVPLHVESIGDRREIAVEDGSVLAECFGDDSDPQCWPITANAHLLAAAPRLLEERRVLLKALKSLLADIQDYQRINNLGGDKNHSQVNAQSAIAFSES